MKYLPVIECNTLTYTYVLCFSEWYEASATMLGEEDAVIGGLLVGLNVIDCIICIKGGDLDIQVGTYLDSSRHFISHGST